MKHHNKKPQKKGKVLPKRPNLQTTQTDPIRALSALAKHSQATNTVLTALSKDKRGAFSSLGGDVDSMIEHGQQAYALVRKMLNAETKQAVTLIQTQLDYNWAMVDITTSVAQGIADNQRDGDSIKLNAVEIRGYYSPGAALGASYPATPTRLVVTASEDEAISVNDAFAVNGTTNAVISYVSWDTRKQFRVLYDKTICLGGSTAAVAVGPAFHSFEIRLNLEDHHVQYAAGTTTVEKGAIQIWAVCHLASPSPYLIASATMEYADN